jgi:hypothetical protein
VPGCVPESVLECAVLLEILRPHRHPLVEGSESGANPIEVPYMKDLERMLEMSRRDQWAASDLDWTRTPRPMKREDEIAVVQYFTDMAVIERLAGALFREQQRRVEDTTLQAIFGTFVVDEARHAKVAEKLADFYDVHRYRAYEPNASLQRFYPHFVRAIRHLSDDVANLYITVGEMVLDIALLRSINDFVADEMSDKAMTLINRDESRHIAIDYHMVEYYASEAYGVKLSSRPRQTLRERAASYRTFASLILAAKPFFHDVFFQPMTHMHAEGRLREAFRRLQLLEAKDGVVERPFGTFIQKLMDVYNHPVAGPLFGPIASRLAGVEPELMKRMNSAAELERARRMSFDELAQDALAAKHETP